MGQSRTGKSPLQEIQSDVQRVEIPMVDHQPVFMHITTVVEKRLGVKLVEDETGAKKPQQIVMPFVHWFISSPVGMFAIFTDEAATEGIIKDLQEKLQEMKSGLQIVKGPLPEIKA